MADSKGVISEDIEAALRRMEHVEPVSMVLVTAEATTTG